MQWFGPHTLFYAPYLGCALVVAFVWLTVDQRLPMRRALSLLAARDTWTAPSTRTDLMFTAAYLLALRVPIAAVESGVFYGVLGYLGPRFAAVVPAGWTLTASPAFEAVLATVVTMLAIDCSSYAAHRLLHAVPALWRVHALHHSAAVLTPLTTYRQHPCEPLLLNASRGAASALGLAGLHAFFIKQTPVITIMGLGAGFFIYMLTANLHHCQLPVRYPAWLRLVLISPHQHQLHHSRDERHYGHNYGVVFSLWDRLFGTYMDAAPKVGELRFGLDCEDAAAPSIPARLADPVVALWRSRRGSPGAGAS